MKHQAKSYLSIAREDCMKAIVLTAILVHAFRSAFQYSSDETTSLYSFWVNLLIGLSALNALVHELRFLLFVRPHLPSGPMGLPFLGSLPYIIWKYQGMLLLFLEEQGKQIQSSVFLSSILSQRLITLADSAGLSWIFVNDRKSYTEVAWPPNISALLGPNAAANTSGAHHKKLRRLMEPFYASRFVQNYSDVICTTTDSELAKWHSSKKGFLPGTVFKLYALRLFLVSSFGEVDEAVLQSLHDDFSIWIQGFLALTGTLRIPGGAFDRSMKARDRLLETCRALVHKFRNENPPESHRAKTTVMGKMVYSKDEEGIGLTEEEILDNTLLLIFAGHDTTFGSINTALYHITQNPTAMQALTKEVATFREPLEYDQLKNEAPVLNAIMHESWRIDPPVSAGFRKFVSAKSDGKSSTGARPTQLEFNGYKFPLGTIFNYNINLTARNNELYPSAETFRFERFLPMDHPLSSREWKSSVDPAAGRSEYPIFGGGTHVCLGKNFAKMELRILLTRIFQCYTIETRNPQKIHAPVNGWSLEFKLSEKQ